MRKIFQIHNLFIYLSDLSNEGATDIDDLAAEIWYVYSRLTNQSLISQGGGGGGRGQTDSHANLTNYGGMGRNFLI